MVCGHGAKTRGSLHQRSVLPRMVNRWLVVGSAGAVKRPKTTADGSRQLNPALALRPLRRPRMLDSGRGHDTGHGHSELGSLAVRLMSPSIDSRRSRPTLGIIR